MVSSFIQMDFTLQELSNDTKNTKIRVRTRKIWPCKVGGLKREAGATLKRASSTQLHQAYTQ